MDTKKNFIAVAGNIGVGKSSLVKLLGDGLGWDPFYEPVKSNPYLADFYASMNDWAFHSQIFFLIHRLKDQQAIRAHPTSVIQDRSIFEDAEIFAKNLFLQNHINKRDYGTYRALYETALEMLPKPDLVVYLQASVDTLLKRIRKRGRAYEKSIGPEYLEKLNELYEEWVHEFCLCPILTIPTDEINFVKNPEHFQTVLNRIQNRLTGVEVIDLK